MSEYNVKNYTEQGGDVTHIGGRLIIEPEAIVEGLPNPFHPAMHQQNSEAVELSQLRYDFNELLYKLRNSGVMEPYGYHFSAHIPNNVREPETAANNAKCRAFFDLGDVRLVCDPDELTAFTLEGDTEAKKWVCIDIGTGLSNLRMTDYNGRPFPEELIEYAEEYGFFEGHFPLYVDAGQQDDYLCSMSFQPAWDEGYGIMIMVVRQAPDPEPEPDPDPNSENTTDPNSEPGTGNESTVDPENDPDPTENPETDPEPTEDPETGT